VSTLMRDALVFASEVGQLQRPAEVLHQLDRRVAKQIGLQVIAIWRVPFDPESRDHHDYIVGRTMFFHSRVSSAFIKECLVGVQKYGPSPMVRLAIRKRAPMTWVEAMRETQPRGQDRWGMELLNANGMRDGLICSVGDWLVNYRAVKGLFRPAPYERCVLNFAAINAASRMGELLDHRSLRRGPKLTPGELAVLQHLSIGQTAKETAQHLDVSQWTVRTHLQRARKKLKAKTPVHAVSVALRSMILR
jgi:DNA-binding CsgD family transcriptional regulator